MMCIIASKPYGHPHCLNPEQTRRKQQQVTANAANDAQLLQNGEDNVQLGGSLGQQTQREVSNQAAIAVSCGEMLDAVNGD